MVQAQKLLRLKAFVVFSDDIWIMHGALFRVQLSLPTVEEKGAVGIPTEISAMPRTTEALNACRRKIRLAEVKAELKRVLIEKNPSRKNPKRVRNQNKT